MLEFYDDLPKEIMEELVNVNPGSEFTFGTRYKIFITPIAEINNNGEQKEIELGTSEKEFYLNSLTAPLVGIDGYRMDTQTEDGETIVGNKVVFKVTMYDNSRMVVDDKYTIKIYNERYEDVTPEEYKVEFSTDDVNNTFELNDASTDESYTLEIAFDLDYTNDGEPPYTYNNKNTYTVEPINKSGVSVGDIKSINNSSESNKIDLLFYKSYKITDIRYIQYSIYNTSGYNQSDTEEFIPRLIHSELDNEDYYAFTLNKNLPTEGRYYVEMQFINENGEIVDTKRIEHIYINN